MVDSSKLLNRLYNLRGEDSVVLKQLDDDNEVALKLKKKNEEEKKELEAKISGLKSDSKKLNTQAEKLTTLLGKSKVEDFAFLNEKLGLDFNPTAVLDRLNNSLSGELEKIDEDLDKGEERLKVVKNDLNSAVSQIDELAIRKTEAIENQAKLNEVFKLALEGSSNITRDSITSLLEKFNFDENEQREAAKLMMFPEDGLYEFDKKYVAPAAEKKVTKEEPEVKKEPVVEVAKEEPVKEKVVEESTNEGGYLSDSQEESPLVLENSEETLNVPKAEEVKEEKIEVADKPAKITKEDVEKALEEAGLNVADFNSIDLNNVVSKFDVDVFKKNVEYVKSQNINFDIFVDNVEFLTDKELVEKMEALVNVGKDPFDIYLNPNVLLKYDLEELKQAINILTDSGLDPKKVPLMAF